MKIFNKEYKALFFDFDGVLADSVEVKTNAFAKLFEKFGLEIQAKVVEHHRNNGGMTRRDKFVYYYQNYLKKTADSVQIEHLCNEFSSLVVDDVVASPEISGAEHFLKKCSEKVQCFVISATPDEEIEQIVRRRGIDGYFKDLFGSSCSKTKHVNNLLGKYGFKPDQSLFFGDAGSDYRAATETDVDFIGILPNSHAPLLKIAPGIRWYKNFLEIQCQD